MQMHPGEDFSQQVRSALSALYDPLVLGKSSLLALLGEAPSPDPVKGLRQVILNAVESLRPVDGTPRGLKAGRVYEILRQRFIEQHTQSRVAENIGLSKRQLQREEKLAIETLCDYLWRTYNVRQRYARELPEKNSEPGSTTPLPGPAPTEVLLDPRNDLEWLKKSTPPQPTTLAREIDEMLTTLAKAIQDNRIAIRYDPTQSEGLAALFLPAPLLRQGLLSAGGVLIEAAPGGQIAITVSAQPGSKDVLLEFILQPAPGRAITLAATHLDSLNYAARLLELCGGSLEASPAYLDGPSLPEAGEPLTLRICLTAVEAFAVLFIEDNADTLELYRRYLADTPYRFIGARSAREGLALAEEIAPPVVVMDVMMPEQDGWSFLSRLRMHPKTEHTAVIVCSILQQAGLALTLGAAEFLHKPVSQADLLAALERQAARPKPPPGI